MKEKKRIKRLALFFAAMIIFTFLSRAADSMTVARVTATRLKKGELLYQLQGIGIVKEKKEKLLKPIEGYVVGKVHVKEGDTVKKGDLLFTYDLKDVKKKKEMLERELKKLQIEYEKASLGTKNSEGSQSMENQELAKKYAEEDLEVAKQAISFIQETVKEEQEKKYKEAKEAYESAEKEKEAALKNSNRVIRDAETALLDLQKPKQKVEKVMEQYKEAIEGKNSELILKAETKVLDFYYKGMYKEKKESLQKAENDLERALQDQKAMEEKWALSIDYNQKFDEEESVRRAYQQQLLNWEADRRSAQRSIDDATVVRDSIKEENDKITYAIYEYKNALEEFKIEYQIKEVYDMLFDLLYRDKIEEDAYEKAEGILKRAKEEQVSIEKEWDEKIQKFEEKEAECGTMLQSMEEGTYDYEKDLKEAKKDIEAKERALETAVLQLKEALEVQKKGKSQQVTENRTEQLTLSSMELDLEQKKKEIQALEKVLQEKGRVYSEEKGIILKMTLEEANTITGQDKISLIMDGFELEASVPKDDLKHFQIGDEVTIEMSEKENLTSVIETMHGVDKEEKITFIMELPKKEGNYRVGDSLSYSAEKKSSAYKQCIEIGAIRQDIKGTFVLILECKKSVLGEEWIAVKRGVTVVEKDFKTAAVEGDILEEQKIIISSDKNISEGDRVRIDGEAEE